MCLPTRRGSRENRARRGGWRLNAPARIWSSGPIRARHDGLADPSASVMRRFAYPPRLGQAHQGPGHYRPRGDHPSTRAASRTPWSTIATRWRAARPAAPARRQRPRSLCVKALGKASAIVAPSSSTAKLSGRPSPRRARRPNAAGRARLPLVCELGGALPRASWGDTLER